MSIRILLICLIALAGCSANRFTSTIMPDMIPEAELAKFRCEQLGLADNQECLLKQHEQIVAERAAIRTAEAGATHNTTNTETTVIVNEPDEEDKKKKR